MAGAPIASVAVAGGGIVALSAALALRRALPQLQVTLVGLAEDEAALADRLPFSLPAIGRFHAAIGLDEPQLIRDGVALHRLGTRYDGWAASRETWHHAFGAAGPRFGGVPFHQLWLLAREEGRAGGFGEYGAAAVLAAADRFVLPEIEADSPLSTHDYALRLDPQLYRARLLAACEAHRIDVVAGAMGAVERRADGGLRAIRLGDGRRIEADLFVDCAGPRAPLLSAVSDAFEDWGEWLPCNRVTLGEAPGGDASPVDTVAALPTGWRFAAPLAARTLTGTVFVAGARPEGGAAEGEAIAIRPGRRPAPWVANVLAIGDAAVALDPLAGANLHLAQTAILRAIDLMPARDCNPLELAEYNRRTEHEVLRVRDFTALHYLRSGRSRDPFWKMLSRRSMPTSLARSVEQWERRGRLPFFEEETFDADSWTSVLLCLGIVPRAVDPVAAGVDLDEGIGAMSRHAERLAELARRVPPYPDYLRRLRETPPPRAAR